MRAIRKIGVGPFKLNAAHARPPTTSAEATSRWHSFSIRATLNLLLEEQYQLCCYSEVRSDLLMPDLGSHIEHCQPKSSYPQRTFDYTNLAASAFNSNDLNKIKREEVFGGHAKGSDYDPAKFISCHQPDCARYFAYLSDGRIVPSLTLNNVDRDKAKYTIDLLNLNSNYLIPLRQKWWDDLDNLREEHITKDWSLEYLVAIDIVPTGNQLSPFFSLTRQFFKEVAEKILKEQAPDLV